MVCFGLFQLADLSLLVIVAEQLSLGQADQQAAGPQGEAAGLDHPQPFLHIGPQLPMDRKNQKHPKDFSVLLLFSFLEQKRSFCIDEKQQFKSIIVQKFFSKFNPNAHCDTIQKKGFKHVTVNSTVPQLPTPPVQRFSSQDQGFGAVLLGAAPATVIFSPEPAPATEATAFNKSLLDLFKKCLNLK